MASGPAPDLWARLVERRVDNYTDGEDLRTAPEKGFFGMKRRAIVVCAALLASSPLMAQARAIDTQRSTITIHVGKSGLLSAAAHDHTINAPISSGILQESPAPRIEFGVETADRKSVV